MRSRTDAPRWLPRLALLLAAVLPGAVSAAPDADNRAALETLRARIQQLQSELEQTRGQRDAVREQLRDTERRVGGLLRELRDTEARERAEQKHLAALEQSRARHRAELGARRQELEQAVRAAYALGKQDYLKLLLSQEDPARVSRTLTYYRYLGEARAARISGLRDALARLDAVEKQIDERRQALAELRAGQLRQKEQLEAARGERRAALARLNERVADRSQEIERLRHDAERLTRLVRELGATLATAPVQPPPAGERIVGKGRWPLPLHGRLIARFGSPRLAGALHWRGIFLAAPEGTAVKAVARGRIAYADWLPGFGLLVVLDHGNGLMTLYGHNQSLYKGVGDWVEAGETIAITGNTGGPPQPGLYFEVREHGEPRDPLDWCKL